MLCKQCGEDIPEAKYCLLCGTEQPEAQAAPEVQAIVGAKKPQESRSRRLLAINSAICAALVALIGFMVVNAETWTKVDDPGHEETFHSEKVETGYWVVKDDGINPCYVGQSWYECINLHIDEYNNACANRLLSSSDGIGFVGKPSSSNYCSRYREMIEQMQADGAANGYSTVASLGSWGHLTATREYKTEQVSNNDYVPPTTHVAVCYLGFLGECPKEGEE